MGASKSAEWGRVSSHFSPKHWARRRRPNIAETRPNRCVFRTWLPARHSQKNSLGKLAKISRNLAGIWAPGNRRSGSGFCCIFARNRGRKAAPKYCRNALQALRFRGAVAGASFPWKLLAKLAEILRNLVGIWATGKRRSGGGFRCIFARNLGPECGASILPKRAPLAPFSGRGCRRVIPGGIYWGNWRSY